MAPKKSGSIVLMVLLPTDTVTTGDGKLHFTVPAALNGFNVTAVNISIPGAISSSGAVTVQLARNRSGVVVDMLTTPASISSGNYSSFAGTVGVVNGANDDLATGDFLRVDVDAAGTGAKGLQVIIDYLEP